ncbi:MAG: hypothetical protein FJY56_04395 [Betaproteobacteria bacterium]|nr:hypothetical protein [Betaproteobacteria bacterium]
MDIRQAQFNVVPQAHEIAPLAAIEPHLVIVFGSVVLLTDPALPALLRTQFGSAHHVGCTTSGEITSDGVSDGKLVITAVRFKQPDFRVASVETGGMDDSEGAGKRLATALAGEGLDAVLVLGQGVNINGSALIDGITQIAGRKVTLTGGLAGDGGKFVRTWTLCDGAVSDRHIVGVGFYGATIQLSHGSFGGWQPFGAARLVTRAKANVLYELDGEPALSIYKRYLGEYARDLPGSGLLFPFAMLGKDHSETGLIRTILGIDETAGSLTLAGDIAEGGYLRLMTASTDALVDGAEAAAEAAQNMFKRGEPCLALLVSCVGRKLVMGGRVDEEVEAVGDVFGKNAVLTGFYSNGEISPYVASPECKLHNQTMTITCLSDA